MVLACITLLTKDAEQFFMYLLIIHESSFAKCLFKGLPMFIFIGIFIIFNNVCMIRIFPSFYIQPSLSLYFKGFLVDNI